MARPTSSGASRSLLETAVAFAGALLVIPILFKTVRGIFRLSLTKKLIGEAVFVGLTALLTNEDVLDKLFGRRGQRGDGALKP